VQCQPEMTVEMHPNIAKDPEFHFVMAIGLVNQNKVRFCDQACELQTT
jgi:hypothetical protein